MMHPSLQNIDSWLPIVQKYLARKPALPLIAVIGPTASGKTAFSIRLAKELQKLGVTAEVVNADSRQFYTGFDIGTAKITEKEMDGVPHHLLSVLDASEECTIAWYQKEAARVIGGIHARGNLPLLVGGSMLYVSAVIDGFEPLPADPEIRSRLEREYDADAGATLFARLSEVDPETVHSIPKENKIYVVRAMEMYESTGIPKSKQQRKKGSPYDTLILGIEVPREQLIERINARTLAMLHGGWIDEVRTLRSAGVSVTDPAMKSSGYREIWDVLDQSTVDLPALSEKISAGVRRYAKRHVTWWKDDVRVAWILGGE